MEEEIAPQNLYWGLDFIGRKLSEICEQTKNANPNLKPQLPNML